MIRAKTRTKRKGVWVGGVSFPGITLGFAAMENPSNAAPDANLLANMVLSNNVRRNDKARYLF